MALFSMILAGATTGLLIGVLVGLSASPVVAAFLGALVTIAAGFLGLSNLPVAPTGHLGEPGERDALVRRFGVAALAMACLCGVLVGIALRARDALGLTPKQLVARWTDAGYSEQQARDIVAAHVGGVTFLRQGTPVTETVTVNSPAAPLVQPTAQVLDRTAVMGMPTPCDRLTSAAPPASDIEREFSAAGGKWRTFIGMVQQLDKARQPAVLAAGWSLACK